MSDSLSFTKLQALGNDFMLVDARRQPFRPSAQTVARLADRRLGVGFDQMLILEPGEDDHVAARVVIRNSDGSGAEQCGNGMRAVALWLHDSGELKDSGEVQTAAGAVSLSYLDPDRITASLPEPDFDPATLGLDDTPQRFVVDGEEITALGVSVGNPHLVVEWPQSPDASTLERIGQALGRHPKLPGGANVGLAHVIGRNRIELRVFERGSGPTLACGSGACAAATGLIESRRAASPVEVVQPGGTLVINWSGRGYPVAMTGPARRVFEGTCPWPT